MREIIRRYMKSLSPTAVKLASAAVLGCAVAIAWGLPAAAASVQTQTLHARSYLMPAGDHSAAAMGPMRPERTTPRLVPVGDAALLRLKSLRSAATTKVITIDGAASSGPDRLGLDAVCNTNIATGFAPSDIHGAAGASRLVVVTNVDIGVYPKTPPCTFISRVSLKTFFSAVLLNSASTTLFDPRVLYDRRVGRFFVTVESRRTSSNDQYQYIAVSKDSTASSWWLYRLTLSQASPALPTFCKGTAANFWDYPSAGASSLRWYITANVFTPTGAATGSILTIDKIPSLSGASITIKCFSGLTFNFAPPIVLDLASTAFFMSPGSGGGSSLVRRNVTSSGTASGSAAGDTLAAPASVGIAAWTAPPDAVQPNGQKLDSIDGRFQSASIQSRGFLWNIHAVNFGGRPLIRWYRLSCTTIACSVLNTVTFTTGGSDHLFNPSFATGSGLAGAPAHITTSRTIPALATTGKAAHLQFFGLNNISSDWSAVVVGTSVGQFAQDGFGTACNSTSRLSCRWGDYSSTTVDPLASGSAWGFNQLISTDTTPASPTTQFEWFTRAGKSTLNLLSSPEASR